MTLRIDGAVRRSLTAEFAHLTEITEQLEDISEIMPGREGSGVRLASLLNQADPLPEARYLTLFAESESYSASVVLEAAANALVVYRRGDEPLPRELGGPIRFFIPDASDCGLPGVDECANVKYLERIHLSAEPGPDTRPRDEDEHAKLHEDHQ